MNAKYYKTICFLRQCAVMRRRFTLPFKLIKSKFWLSESYYPELPNHKSRFRIFWELMGHIMKYGSIEWYYFAYGFDVQGLRDKRDYMDESDFIWRLSMNNTIKQDWDYTCILRDKKLFADILSSWSYLTPCTVEVVNSEQGIDDFCDKICANTPPYSEKHLFCKPIDGQCGAGTFNIKVTKDGCLINNELKSENEIRCYIKSEMSKEPYIIQTFVEQLPEINAIYDKSINTMRLTTIYDKDKHKASPYFAFFRTGANGNIADNWAIGGLLIGIDLASGKLQKMGIFKHGYGTKTEVHPDTGFRFEGFQLPMYEDAVKQALELHERLNGIPIIGWDIAFTTDGPMFIEGNDNIEIGPIQSISERGHKKEMEKYLHY